MKRLEDLKLPVLRYHYKNLKLTCGFSFDRQLAMKFAERLASSAHAPQTKKDFYVAYIRNWVSQYWDLTVEERPKLNTLTSSTLSELGYDQPRFL